MYLLPHGLQELLEEVEPEGGGRGAGGKGGDMQMDAHRMKGTIFLGELWSNRDSNRFLKENTHPPPHREAQEWPGGEPVIDPGGPEGPQEERWSQEPGERGEVPRAVPGAAGEGVAALLPEDDRALVISVYSM